MKITAGLGNLEAFPQYADAGADEFFCGYLPPSWLLRFGPDVPINRREVLYCPVQIGSLSEMRLLLRQAEARGISLSLTFNSPHYTQPQREELINIMEGLRDIGYRSVIIADPSLLMLMNARGLTECLSVHVSGEMGIWNTEAILAVRRLGARRIIFPRQLPVHDIAACIRNAAIPGMEYEVFVLNENCHYQGGWCSTLHCDAFPPMCRVPYRISGAHISRNDAASSSVFRTGVPGESGCAVCALWQLREAGVTHLKIVGRGELQDRMTRDIAFIHTALGLLSTADHEQDWIRMVQTELFPQGCSGACYDPGGIPGALRSPR